MTTNIQRGGVDLTPERVEARALILLETDDNRCESCAAEPPEGSAAEDAKWFIDSEAGPADATGAPVTLAVIRCPNCW